MGTYLSIDLDYWQNDADELAAIRFLHKILGLRVPKVIFHEHDSLLEFVNESGCSKLINVDYHSDFANFGNIHEMETEGCNCGTWVDFAEPLKTFEWRYPSYYRCFKRGEGRCDRYQAQQPSVQTRCWSRGKGLRGLEVAHKEGVKGIRTDAVKAVGIAISSDFWWDRDTRYTVFPAIMHFLFSNRRKFSTVCRSVSTMREWS